MLPHTGALAVGIVAFTIGAEIGVVPTKCSLLSPMVSSGRAHGQKKSNMRTSACEMSSLSKTALMAAIKSLFLAFVPVQSAMR